MATDVDDRIEAELNAFNDQLVKHNLTPTWAYYQELVSMEPMPSYKAYLWKAALLEYVVSRAAELVDLERGGERRAPSPRKSKPSAAISTPTPHASSPPTTPPS